MVVSLKGDKDFENLLSTKDKALRINLNENIYGTFAEIGAGQEVARHFFRSGGASGTIAKTMSAYDKGFSDAIYGIEDDKRYVTKSRLTKMLKREINLLETRVKRDSNPDKMFFSFANTVATLIGHEIEIYNTTGAFGAARASGVMNDNLDSFRKKITKNDHVMTFLPLKNTSEYEDSYSRWKEDLQGILKNK